MQTSRLKRHAKTLAPFLRGERYQFSWSVLSETDTLKPCIHSLPPFLSIRRILNYNSPTHNSINKHTTSRVSGRKMMMKNEITTFLIDSKKIYHGNADIDADVQQIKILIY